MTKVSSRSYGGWVTALVLLGFSSGDATSRSSVPSVTNYTLSAQLALLEQTGQPPVGEELPPGLAGRAVLEGPIRERHFRHRIATDRTGQAGTRVHPQAGPLLGLQGGGLLTDRARHRVGEHLLDRLGEALDLVRLQVRDQRERGQPGHVHDLVGERGADAGHPALVGEEPLQPGPVRRRDGAEAGRVQAQRVRAELADAGYLGRVADHVDSQPFLRALLGHVEAGAVVEVQAERERAPARL